MLSSNKVINMNKFIKVMISILLIGIVLAIGGYVTGGCRSFAIYNSKIIFNEDKNLVKKSYDISDAKKINVDVKYIDKIEIVASDEFKVETESIDFGDGYNSITCDVNDGVLSLKENNSKPRISFNFLSFNTSSEKIKISVPKDISLEDVNILSSSSDLSISDVLLQGLSVKCDYGDVNLKNINTEGDIKVESDSGKLKFDNISCRNLSSNCDYGNINGTNIKVNNYNVDADSGDIKLSYLNVSEMITMNDKYGDIKIDQGDINNMKIVADSGKVNVSSTGLNLVDINSKYGDVSINTSESDNLFNYKLQCKYGDVSINGDSESDNYTRSTNASKNINIECDSGDIKIKTGK